MKTHLFRLLLVLSIVALAMNACKKDDDDEQDEKDGQITFYTTSGDCGAIDIQLNGEDVGPLSSVYTGSSEPTCGDANTLTIDVDVGIHEYEAQDNCNNIWTGSIIINMGDCKVKLLSR
jgi:hypothetical protein